MSDQPQAGQAPEDGKIDKRSREYKAGYADGLAAANRTTRPPLFEAAKALVAFRRNQPLDELDDAITRLEHEYGETLTGPDRDLILAIARRHQTSGSARDQAIHDLARPRRPRPLPEDKAATSYETVA